MTEATTIEEAAETAETAEIDFADAERHLDTIVAAKVAEQVAEQVAIQMAAILARQAAADEGAPKTMTANVYDRFFSPETGVGRGGADSSGAVLVHYRCDNAVSTKMIVFDMELMDQYTSGELEIPRTEHGRKMSVETLCVIPGETLDWVAGHCYVYTENQKRNVERAMERARLGLQGGMAGIYEDTGGGAADWQCFTCQSHPKFSNQETYVNHMNATHGANLIVSAA